MTQEDLDQFINMVIKDTNKFNRELKKVKTKDDLLKVSNLYANTSLDLLGMLKIQDQDYIETGNPLLITEQDSK